MQQGILQKNRAFNRNTYIWWSAWIVSVGCAILYENPWVLWAPFGLLLMNDLLKILCKFDLFDPSLTTRNAYNLGHTAFIMGETDSGLDYGFNLYRSDATVDLCKTAQQGQRDKFLECADILNVQPGEKILDVGCGYGDWIRFLKEERQLDVVGINICDEQVKTAQSRGLNVLHCDWKHFDKSALSNSYENSFDYVTFFDTIEHYCPAKYRFSPKKQREIYEKMFAFAKRMLKPEGKILLSCYHQVKKVDSLNSFIATWALNNNVEGFYPKGQQGLSDPAKNCGLHEVGRWDKTEDYRLTGVLNKETWQKASGVHFSKEHVKNIVFHVLIDPYFIYRLLCRKVDYWMMCYGENAYSKEYNPTFREKVTYVALYWILFEKK